MAHDFWHKLNKPVLALAPMAGITDSAFRQICRRYGADVVYSEMASASALFFKPDKTLELVRFKESERPYVVQLFGKDPEHFAKAAKIITEKIKPDGIDINFGCPAKKVFGHGSGCALMPQKELARQIISAVCQNSDLPVSIKIRAGIKKKPNDDLRETPETTALEFVKNTRDLPYSAVMIHGRTYEGGFFGSVDLSVCQEIKKIAPEKIILGNGGIQSAEDAAEIMKNHPLLDGLGIARGAWGRPWIFSEIKEKLSPSADGQALVTRKDGEKPSDFSQVKRIMLEHAELIHKDKGRTGLFEIRKHMAWYVRDFPGASHLRKKLVLAGSLKEIKEILVD